MFDCSGAVTFFFASLGAFYSRVGQGAAVITVPTEQFKNGDFSSLGVPIYDPATTRPDGNGGFVRDPFPGNIIPANRISPAATAIRQYLPTPDNIPEVMRPPCGRGRG